MHKTFFTRLFSLSVLLSSAFLITACASTSVDTTSASATSGSQATDLAQAPAIENADPRVCKRVTPIGTRISQRICMKKSQWEEQSGGSGLHSEVTRRATQVGNPSGQD